MSVREHSLLGFVAELGIIGGHMVHAQVEGLEHALEIIKTEAKASLGTYQEQAGPFAAWEELAPSTQADRARQGYDPNEPEHRTGRMGETIETTVINPGRLGEVGSDDQILEWQELGTVNMPPRSIIGGAAVRMEQKVCEAIEGPVIMALVGNEVFQQRLRFSRR